MSGSAVQLVIRQGPIPGQIFELNKGQITIGRELGNDIVINDPEVSRKHARLLLQGDHFRIEDLGSTNGTFVNGQRLTAPHLLAFGEIINLGESIILVYEPVQPSFSATLVGSSAGASALPVPPFTPEFPPAPAHLTPRPGTYSRQSLDEAQAEYDSLAPAQHLGSFSAGPVVEPAAPFITPRKKAVNLWLLSGCGCLLIVVCFFVALAFYIDQTFVPGGQGLYCEVPFVYFFKLLGRCP